MNTFCDWLSGTIMISVFDLGFFLNIISIDTSRICLSAHETIA